MGSNIHPSTIVDEGARRSAVTRKDESRPTFVRQGATLGAHSTIVCGATIGRYAPIGAGAGVNRDVPDFALMLGVPARQAGWLSRHGERLDSSPATPPALTRATATGSLKADAK